MALASDSGFYSEITRSNGTTFWIGPYPTKKDADYVTSVMLLNRTDGAKSATADSRFYHSHPANQSGPPPDAIWFARFFSEGDWTGGYFSITGLGRENGVPDFSWGRLSGMASSAEVKPGFRVRAFTGFNFTGTELRLDKNPQLGRANFVPGPSGLMRFGYFPNSPGFKFNDNINSAYCEVDR
jgi:hypothetical protein